MGREGHDDVSEAIKSLILNDAKLRRPIFRPNHLNGLTGESTSRSLPGNNGRHDHD